MSPSWSRGRPPHCAAGSSGGAARRTRRPQTPPGGQSPSARTRPSTRAGRCWRTCSRAASGCCRGRRRRRPGGRAAAAGAPWGPSWIPPHRPRTPPGTKAAGATWPSSSSSLWSGPRRRPASVTAGGAGARRKSRPTTPCGTRPGTSWAARRARGRLGGRPGPRRSGLGTESVSEEGERRGARTGTGTGPGRAAPRAHPLCDASCGGRRLRTWGKRTPAAAPPRTLRRRLPHREGAGALRTGRGASAGNGENRPRTRTVRGPRTTEGRRGAQTPGPSPGREAQK